MAPHSSTLAWKMPGGWRRLVGCSPWGCKELDMTERLHFDFSLSLIGEGNGNPLQCSFFFFFYSSVLVWRIPGTGSLVGCSPWGCIESDMTEVT